MHFFFDHMMSPVVARALRALDRENKITVLQKQFKPDTRDLDWIPIVGQHDWVIVGGDQYRGPGERETLVSAGVRTYILETGLWVARKWPGLWDFLRAWNEIRRHAETQQQHCIWNVSAKAPRLRPVRLSSRRCPR